MPNQSSLSKKLFAFFRTKMSLKKVNDSTDFISKLIIIIGFPIAIFQYNSVTEKEKNDREYEIYNSLDQGFIEWEKLCLAYPNLDIFDIQDSIPPILNAKEKKEQVILFTILFSLFERAFVLYGDESTELKKSQWEGWNQYILDYFKRDNFRWAWKISGSTFEAEFQLYMN